MRSAIPYRLKINALFDEQELLKGTFIVILHASRIPPHIGMITGKMYHSLSIKGQETNVPLDAFLKNIRLRRIQAVFVSIRRHSTFSNDYLREHFISNITRFPKVSAGAATCLSPLKLFFEEIYNIPADDIRYVFDLLPALEKQGLITGNTTLNIDGEEFGLPVYDMDEINQGIAAANKEAKFIRERI